MPAFPWSIPFDAWPLHLRPLDILPVFFGVLVVFHDSLRERKEETHGPHGHTRLAAADVPHVERIGQMLLLYVLAGGRLSRRGECRRVYNGSELVLWRYNLVSSDDLPISIRLHLFPNAAETYIHNHKSSFISMCMLGGCVGA